MAYKVNDKVILIIDGKEYVVVATKNEPYNGDIFKDLYPDPEDDYVIVEHGGGSFKSVSEGELDPIRK